MRLDDCTLGSHDGYIYIITMYQYIYIYIYIRHASALVQCEH